MSLVYLSGDVGGVIQSFAGNQGQGFQQVIINIPAKKKLKIKKVMYHVEGNWFRLAIADFPDLDKWMSAANEGDESPNYILYQNKSNILFKLGVGVMIYNMDAVAQTLFPHSGWSIVLSIE